jgi:hypothetical protein
MRALIWSAVALACASCSEETGSAVAEGANDEVEQVTEAKSVPALPKASSAMLIFPRGAASLAPVSLGELVEKAIPANEGLGWDHLQIDSVLWLTEGVDYHEGGTASRFGVSRVRASGATARMLRQKWEELAWGVELATDGNAKWGPTSIDIRPGLTEASFKGDYICFGTGFEGCEFPITALDHPDLKLSKVCEIGSGGGSSVVMSARTTDGRTGTVVYQGSGGSGGYSNSIEITTLAPAEYCQTHKDRGY